MTDKALRGTLLDEQVTFSLVEICEVCSCRSEWIIELVSEGILEPLGRQPEEWNFPGVSVATAQSAQRLERDLGINLAGIALALELLNEVETLRSLLQRQNQSGP